MTNDGYLVLSYFVAAGVSIGMGILAYASLYSPFRRVASAIPWVTLGRLLVRTFRPGMLFPALMGFFAVSYASCNVTTYEKIVADRSYLVCITRQQLSSSLSYLTAAIFVWGFVVAFVLVLSRRSQKPRQDAAE